MGIDFNGINLNDLVSPELAAAELGKSLEAVRRLNRLGLLPFQRINGKCIRILRPDLERLKRELAGEVR